MLITRLLIIKLNEPEERHSDVQCVLTQTAERVNQCWRGHLKRRTDFNWTNVFSAL